MVTLNVVGLNCGTSIDGIDVVHCRISSLPNDDVEVQVLSYHEAEIDPRLRAEVLRLCRPDNNDAATNMAEVCDLNFALGRQFAKAVSDSGIDLDQVDLIASHGQTLWHQPLGANRSTLQMAEPAVIAHETKRTVASGFRVAELAAGRQGAPLAGFFEAGLLSDADTVRVIQNIGGIGNATVLPAIKKTATGNQHANYIAFDTGPGNVFVDAAMRILTDGREHYDRDGILGAKGEADIDHKAVEEYLNEEPYFKKEPPKTTGRELFSDDTARTLVNRLKSGGSSDEAIIATLTRITAESIARSYEAFAMPLLQKTNCSRIDEIYICGGGAHNPNILKHLQARFPEATVQKLDDAPVKLDPNAKEALLFALLGFLSICGRSIPIPADAESTEQAILGSLTPGDNYSHIMNKVVQDRDFGKYGILRRITMKR